MITNWSSAWSMWKSFPSSTFEWDCQEDEPAVWDAGHEEDNEIESSLSPVRILGSRTVGRCVSCVVNQTFFILLPGPSHWWVRTPDTIKLVATLSDISRLDWFQLKDVGSCSCQEIVSVLGPSWRGEEGPGATVKMRLSGTGPGVSRVLAVERDGCDTPTQWTLSVNTTFQSFTKRINSTRD